MWCCFYLFRLRNIRSMPWCVCLSHPPASMLLLYHMQVVHGVASSSDAGVLLALVPWLPCAVRAARVAAGCVREPGLAVCPASWPACVPVAWCCGAVLCPAPWCVGLLCLPCGPGLCVGLIYGPLISLCCMGLFCGLVFRALYGPLKKCFIFAWFFGYVFPGFFPGFVFALKFPARFSGPQRLDFFSPDFFA